MEIGMIGLGRMGANMVRRLMRGGHRCVVFNRTPGPESALAGEGAVPASSVEDLVARLAPPRVVWVMVPAGRPTESVVETLGRLLTSGDAVIDGGNTHYEDDVRRARILKERGIFHLDAGTSGGVWGVERGYCLMIGGEAAAVARAAPAFRTLAPGRGAVSPARANAGSAADGWLHCGPSGAGHFVKMIHNGIEYGLMEAYAEGFDLLRNAASSAVPPERRYDLPLADIAELWRRGSVIGSWLLDLSAAALAEDEKLSRFTGYVEDSGEGRWTVDAALEQAVPAEVLTAALYKRFRSRREHTFAEKLLSAMRQKFGGHREPPAGST